MEKKNKFKKFVIILCCFIILLTFSGIYINKLAFDTYYIIVRNGFNMLIQSGYYNIETKLVEYELNEEENKRYEDYIDSKYLRLYEEQEKLNKSFLETLNSLIHQIKEAKI